jgi:acyl carrier protein
MDPETFIKTQVAEICGVDVADLVDDGKLIGFGLDSVRLVDLMIGIEETFDLEINEMDPRLGQVKTVRQLVDYIELRLAEK